MDSSSLSPFLVNLLRNMNITGDGDVGSATSSGLPSWPSVLEKITEQLEETPTFKDTFLSLRGDDLERASFCFENATVKRLIGEYLDQCKLHLMNQSGGKKNSAKVALIREQSHRAIAQKKYFEAYKLCNQALMFATKDDTLFASLFVDRAALYFIIEQFENALEDIERAFSLGYHKQPNPPENLFYMKGTCYLKLGRFEELDELIESNLATTTDPIHRDNFISLKKSRRRVIKRDVSLTHFQDPTTVGDALTVKQVFQSHEQFPWLNRKVEVRHNSEKGFNLITKEEMKFGEVVAIGKPFVCLDPERDSFERCNFCLASCFELVAQVDETSDSSKNIRMFMPVACTDCSTVLYCSEKCRAEAWTAFHQFECSQMVILRQLDGPSHLALRSLYTFGGIRQLEEASRKCNSPVNPVEVMANQCNPSLIYSMPTSKMNTYEGDLAMILTAFFLFKLVQMGHLEGQENAHEGWCTFLLRHLHQLKAADCLLNSKAISSSASTVPKLYSLYGITSLMAHSCDPWVASSSVLSESYSSNVKVFYATRAIPAGTVLTLGYAFEETTDITTETTDRKVFLLNQYGLKCACTRCERESRDTLDPETGVYYPIGCFKCGSLMIRSQGEAAADGSFECSSTNCSLKYNARQMKIMYERLEKVAILIRRLPIREGILLTKTHHTVNPSVTQLKTALESKINLLYRRSHFLATLYGHLAQHYSLLILTPKNPFSNEPLKRASMLTHSWNMNYNQISVQFAEKSLAVFEELYGGPGTDNDCVPVMLKDVLDNFEMAVDWILFGPRDQSTKLAELQARCGERFQSYLQKLAFDTMLV